MKKTILLSSLFAVGAALAGEVTSGNAVGALDIEVGSTPQQTLIAVPFVGYENGGAVKVEDMVKTSDLAQDSKLYVPNGTVGGYDTWKLDADGKWIADKKVTISANETMVGESLGQDKAVANRGDSFWLEPKFKNEATSGTIFLLGQGETTQGSSQVSVGWNLIGNTATVEKTIPDGAEGEKVCVPNAAGGLDTYTWRNSGWLKGRTPNNTITIQPGQGFWFLAKSKKTIQW